MGAFTKTLSSPLTVIERAELAELEVTARVGIRRFVEAGKALARIRDAQLYRETHDDFEAYLAERLKMSRVRAIQLVRAAEVVRILAPTGAGPVPTSELQARLLTRLSPDSQREAWTEAVANAPRDTTGNPVVTPEAVKAAAAKRDPKGKRNPS